MPSAPQAQTAALSAAQVAAQASAKAVGRTSPACLLGHARHRPGRAQSYDRADVVRARCRGCGLNLMRTAISRHWIIADRLG